MSKTCLIIGASGEIGSSTVLSLVKKGYSVGLQYHSNAKSIDKLNKNIPHAQRLGFFQADLSTDEGIRSFINMIDSDWDSVVFAGGHLWKGLFQDMEEADMDALYRVHVKAPWLITRHLLPSMIRNREGNIVVVSSLFGEEGASMEVAYSAVKGAQISFVKGLAKEVGPSGIRVNAVTPGLIATKMNEELSEEEFGAVEEEIPLSRAGRTEEVGDAIEFLLSDRSSYITGHILKVNGGWS
ncbi:elongation factor P 5-aminopentanone reductase [Halobacillus yeomjeoni]|uniref:SDR family oxidoreductase n=1 Tax=Halobacillus yeomjeoni TaxID=311194 RepID=A0A931HTA1_9BACI|nr:SDR family oxidoreductase [Halobacillus yeomjeoni]MBH0229340.1 SDR family oxidoreductase [Halobacillus yeomjeoni]